MAGLHRRGARRTRQAGAAVALAAALAASLAASPAAAEPAPAPAALAGPGPQGAERLLAQCAALDAHILGLLEDHAEFGGGGAAVAGLLAARALLRERQGEQALSRYESIALDRPRQPLR